MSAATAARLGLPPHHGHTSRLRLLKSSLFLYSSCVLAFQTRQQDKQNTSRRAPARIRVFLRCGLMSDFGTPALYASRYRSSTRVDLFRMPIDEPYLDKLVLENGRMNADVRTGGCDSGG